MTSFAQASIPDLLIFISTRPSSLLPVGHFAAYPDGGGNPAEEITETN
jgi:hypothetical protein